jgi:hypothetical protein
VQRRVLLTALTALCAATAFAVGAAAFDDTVADAGPSLEDGDGPTENGSDGGTRGKSGSRSGSGGSVDGCLGCGLSARSLLGALLPAVSPLLLVGLAVAVVAGAALLGLRPGRDRAAAADDGGTDRPPAGEGRTERPGPSDTAATNDVYRAWVTLTDRVDVPDPGTTTPREHARAAVEAGLDRGAVQRLRELFETVRYGEASPTTDRERAARAAADRLDGAGEREPNARDAEERADEEGTS